MAREANRFAIAFASQISLIESQRPAAGQRDYEEKRTEYRDIGVREYWIIDRFRRTLTVYHRRGARWARRIIGENESYRTPLLPGFELPLAKLLAVSDHYAP